EASSATGVPACRRRVADLGAAHVTARGTECRAARGRRARHRRRESGSAARTALARPGSTPTAAATGAPATTRARVLGLRAGAAVGRARVGLPRAALGAPPDDA